MRRFLEERFLGKELSSSIDEAVEIIKKEFLSNSPNRTQAVYPQDLERLRELISASVGSPKELVEFMLRVVERIRRKDFWRLKNEFVVKHGYSFFAFVYSINDLLQDKGRPLRGEGEHRIEVYDPKEVEL